MSAANFLAGINFKGAKEKLRKRKAETKSKKRKRHVGPLYTSWTWSPDTKETDINAHRPTTGISAEIDIAMEKNENVT